MTNMEEISRILSGWLPDTRQQCSECKSSRPTRASNTRCPWCSPKEEQAEAKA
jgi:hypothetical protein